MMNYGIVSAPRISLADVARKAGVSRAAASYALRDDPNIALATRKHIQEVARELGYRPDPMLTKLMAHLHAGRAKRYVGTIAFLNTSRERGFLEENPALKRFFPNAAERAFQLGYDTETFWLHEPNRSPKRLAEILLARGIRGLVLGSTGRSESVIDFPWDEFAAIAVGYSITHPPLDRVVTDHYANTLLAIRRLRAAGYQRIGLIVRKDREAMMQNLHAAALLAFQLDIPKAQRVPPFIYTNMAPQRLRQWHDAWRPEAILYTRHGYDHITAAGIRVPEDVTVISLLLWDESAGVSGIRPGVEFLGAIAIQLLISQLQHDDFGLPLNPKVVKIEGCWSGELAPCPPTARANSKARPASGK